MAVVEAHEAELVVLRAWLFDLHNCSSVFTRDEMRTYGR